MNRKQEQKYQNILNILQKRSYRLTINRKKLAKLFAENDHVSINNIIKKLTVTEKTINIMSIYNTIDLFLKEDIIDAKANTDKEVFYELSGNIIHVICTNCHSLIHLNNIDEKDQGFIDIVALEKFLEQNKNFSFSHFSLEVHSTCDNCLNKIKNVKDLQS